MVSEVIKTLRYVVYISVFQDYVNFLILVSASSYWLTDCTISLRKGNEKTVGSSSQFSAWLLNPNCRDAPTTQMLK